MTSGPRPLPGGAAQAQTTAAKAAATRYPIVPVHGMLGWDSIAGIDCAASVRPALFGLIGKGAIRWPSTGRMPTGSSWWRCERDEG